MVWTESYQTMAVIIGVGWKTGRGGKWEFGQIFEFNQFPELCPRERPLEHSIQLSIGRRLNLCQKFTRPDLAGRWLWDFDRLYCVYNECPK